MLLLLLLLLFDICCVAERRFPTSTAEDLALKLYNSAPIKASKRFSKPKKSSTAFDVQHYAGEVQYQTNNFLDKNRDYVIAEQQALLQVTAQAAYENILR